MPRKSKKNDTEAALQREADLLSKLSDDHSYVIFAPKAGS